MAAKNEEKVWYCDHCRRPMDWIIRTEMWKPGTDQPFRVCNSTDCWDYAKAQGYNLTSRGSRSRAARRLTTKVDHNSIRIRPIEADRGSGSSPGERR